MDYQKIYENIISKAKSKNRIKLKKDNIDYVYYENHHILPKCLGGGEENENKVLLTAKEHYICHKLLIYIYPKNRKIAKAFCRMTFSKKLGNIVSSRDYVYAKELCANNFDKFNSIYKKGKSYKEQMIKKYGYELGILKTNEYKEKISNNNAKENNPMYKKGYKISGEKNGRYGKPSTLRNTKLSEETKNKIRLAHIGIKRHLHLCPYCNREISDGNFQRWHAENCKQKK